MNSAASGGPNWIAHHVSSKVAIISNKLDFLSLFHSFCGQVSLIQSLSCSSILKLIF